MNFGELIEAVGEQTTRPELESLIKIRINSFIRTVSLSGRYWPDRVEGTLLNPEKTTDFIFALPNRFRAVDYIKYKNIERHLNRKEPATIDRNIINDTDVYYLSGSNLIIKSLESVDSFKFSYWEWPQDLRNAEDSNWITERLGIVVADMTSELIMGMIGERVETTFFQRLNRAELQILVEDVLGDHTATVYSGRA